jgi:hypothetical protein
MSTTTVTAPVTGFLASVDGLKTYIGAGIGILAVLVTHFLHIPIPGVQLDDTQWLSSVYTLFMVIAGRSAIAKLDQKPVVAAVQQLKVVEQVKAGIQTPPAPTIPPKF